MKRQFNRVILIFFVPINMIIAQEKSVLIIDAGHGGIDIGAIGTNDIKEKNITLAIAKAMLEINSTILNNQYDIYMTRYADTLISLSHRTKLARALQPDLFLSIHCNHAKNNNATGIEMYIHRGTDMKLKNQKESNRIALSMIDTLTEKLGYRSRGVKTANFQVLRETVQTCPTILLELGFLSNKDEADHLKFESNSNALALAILLSIKI